MREHHFDKMPTLTRSVAIELVENLPAIEQWRSTLSKKDRRRLAHPLSNVRRWLGPEQIDLSDCCCGPHRFVPGAAPISFANEVIE